MIELARAAARFFLPSVCLACQRRPTDDFFRGGVCAECWRGLPASEPERCARCDETLPGAPFALGADPSHEPAAPVCGRCLIDPPEFHALRAAAPYRGSARDILLAFKFQGADYLGARMAEVMTRRLARPDATEIAAVPATRRSRRRRGYQPAEVLAAALSRRLGLPFSRTRLAKVRETEVQSRLRASARRDNVRGAFRVAGPPAARVLLVDDVATSGATARECARRLTSAGARAVTVWCFARASRADLAAETA